MAICTYLSMRALDEFVIRQSRGIASSVFSRDSASSDRASARHVVSPRAVNECECKSGMEITVATP